MEGRSRWIAEPVVSNCIRFIRRGERFARVRLENGRERVVSGCRAWPDATEGCVGGASRASLRLLGRLVKEPTECPTERSQEPVLKPERKSARRPDQAILRRAGHLPRRRSRGKS